MSITNPMAVTYSNEIIRPMCERFRNIKAEIDAALVTWGNVIDAICPDDPGEILEDGRAVDGVSILSGEDINKVIVKFTQYQSALDQAGAANTISKPCVRPLVVG